MYTWSSHYIFYWISGRLDHYFWWGSHYYGGHCLWESLYFQELLEILQNKDYFWVGIALSSIISKFYKLKDESLLSFAKLQNFYHGSFANFLCTVSFNLDKDPF